MMITTIIGMYVSMAIHFEQWIEPFWDYLII